MEKVLLINGGGTLGMYTGKELLARGFQVDILCLEDFVSDNPNLTFYKLYVNDESLAKFLENRQYDGLVDFTHYADVTKYPARHKLLMAHTKHLIFLSSYRVYADVERPIRETSPQIIDIPNYPNLPADEGYAMPKCRGERFLRSEGIGNWTIIRPLISFSHNRVDLLTIPVGLAYDRMLRHKKLLMPEAARNVTAGLIWSGNTGKMIAALVLNEKAYGEAFTLGTDENETWEAVTKDYEAVYGAEFAWVSTEDYLRYSTNNDSEARWILFGDRLLNRAVDNSKIREATGLKREDFLSIREGLAYEKQYFEEHTEFKELMLSKVDQKFNVMIDAYLEEHNL